LEEGGRRSFIEGIKAIYPNTIVAIAPILPERSGSWKKIVKLTKARMKMGMKMVAMKFPGYLYRGITKWVY